MKIKGLRQRCEIASMWNKSERISSWSWFCLRPHWLHAVLLLIKLSISNRVEENRSKSALITPRCWFFFNIFIFCIIIIWKQAVGQSLRRPPAASRPEFAAASRSHCLGRSSDALWPWGWPLRGCDAGGSSGRPGRWRRTCSLPLHSGQKPELLQRED